MGRRFRRKKEERQMALRRIGHLFEVARRRLREGRALTEGGDGQQAARRSVRLARRISKRYQTGLPRGLRDRYCRGCDGPLVPGQTARVRVREGMVRTTCLSCGRTQRRPFVNEQRARRQARDALLRPAPVAGAEGTEEGAGSQDPHTDPASEEEPQS